jgi:hypothetical protein
MRVAKFLDSLRDKGMYWALALAMTIQALRAAAPSERYVFVENPDRTVDIYRGKWLLTGKLDKNGDFIQENRFSRSGGSAKPTPPNVINFPGTKPRKAYEFRSGMLVPGELQPDGHFVPEAGGKIIRFTDYQYTPTAIPIWNLPGVFVTEAEAAKLKVPKPADKK